ncbi:MAG TPA: DUF4402 domain-containing protein [Dysgonamonadaceae bacterium]|nr:DUF4402 domain-containing protein [Dysgonamonadaceae bacterium]
MRKTVFLLASLFVMVLATQRVNAQTDPSATANATATIVKAISITKGADLQFGKIIAASTAGTVVVTPTGSRSYTGEVVLFDTGSDHQAASFTASGLAGETYSLAFSATPLIGPSGSTPMTIAGFVHSATGTLDASGKETFSVGGTLNVGANQTPGQYTGTFSVTAAHE